MEKIEDILKLVTGNLTWEEKEKVLSRIEGREENIEIFQKLKTAWAILSSSKKLNDYEVENAFVKIQGRISGKKKGRMPQIIKILKYAAAIFFLLSLTTIYYLNKLTISRF